MLYIREKNHTLDHFINFKIFVLTQTVSVFFIKITCEMYTISKYNVQNHTSNLGVLTIGKIF